MTWTYFDNTSKERLDPGLSSIRDLPTRRVSYTIHSTKRYAVYLSRRIVALQWAACPKGLVERVSFLPIQLKALMPKHSYLSGDRIEPASIGTKRGEEFALNA